MKLYDITQELFHAKVYPGDEAPSYERTLQIATGDVVNLTVFRMCAHNGTHIDAPYHFIKNGKTVDQIELDRFIGDCTVIEHVGEMTAEDVHRIMTFAKKRILLKGRAVVTLEAAKAFNLYEIYLIGNESQTVGPEDAPMPVHLELLGKEVVLLEGIVLDAVEPGDYWLNAAPINLGGADGAPCRAILIQF
jgi:arylformamidase